MIKALFLTVGIHTCQQDLSCPPQHGFFCPIAYLYIRLTTPSVCINHVRFFLFIVLCIYCDDDALGAGLGHAADDAVEDDRSVEGPTEGQLKIDEIRKPRGRTVLEEKA